MENRFKILVLLLLFHFRGVAQISIIDKNYYGLQEGLPSQEIEGIVKTEEGLIWLSTVEGIVRFDGYKMQVFSQSKNSSKTQEIEFTGAGALSLDTFQNLIITPELASDSIEIFNTKTLKTTAINIKRTIKNNSLLDTYSKTDQPTFFLTKDKNTLNISILTEDFKVKTVATERIETISDDYKIVAKTKELFYVLDKKNGAIVKWEEGKKIEIFENNYINKEFISPIFHLDAKKRIWFTPNSSNQLFYFDTEKEIFSSIIVPAVTNKIDRIWEDKVGNLIFGTSGLNYFTNLFLYTQDEKYIDLDKVLGEERKRIHIQGDNFKHKINVGSQAGLYELYFQKESKIENFLNIDLKKGAYGNIMRGFAEDESKNVYAQQEGGDIIKVDFETRNYEIIHRLDSAGVKLENQCGGPLLYHAGYIFSVSCDQNGDGYLHRLDTKGGKQKVFNIPDKKVFARALLQKGNQLWLFCINKSRETIKIYTYDFQSEKIKKIPFIIDGNDLIKKNYFNTASFGSNDDVWLGGYKGLMKFNTKSKLLKIYSQPSIQIYDIIVEKDKLLLATLSRGVITFNPKTEKFGDFYFSKGIDGKKEKVPLSNYLVSFIQPCTKRGEYLIGTFNGLNLVSLDERVVRTFDITDGLSNYEFNRLSKFKSSEGKFYLGGINGFDAFFKEDLERKLSVNPVLTRFYQFGKNDKEERSQYGNYKLDEHIVLPADNLYFGFEFTLPEYSIDKGNMYRTYLEGYEKEISEFTLTSEIRYSQLPAGEYKLHIQAYNKQGDRSDKDLIILLKVKEYFYKTGWFFSLVFLAGLGLTFYLTRRYTNLNAVRQQKEEQIKRKFTELELDALRAQLNPHFIFNALGAIQYFIDKNNTEQARGYLADFARLMRMFLESSKKQTITLEEELELLKLYSSLEQLRFRDKFSVNFIVDEDVDFYSIEIPSSLLQPFVENAINHGLFHLKEGGELSIEIKQISDSETEVIVIDNGIGREKSAELKKTTLNKHKSRATQIINERINSLNSIGDFKIDVDTTDAFPAKENCGTKVRVLISEDE